MGIATHKIGRLRLREGDVTVAVHIDLLPAPTSERELKLERHRPAPRPPYVSFHSLRFVQKPRGRDGISGRQRFHLVSPIRLRGEPHSLALQIEKIGWFGD